MQTDRSDSLAGRQLAHARRDPRLAHGREAVVADWWAAMEAAERVRTLADWGLQELIDSEAHEERRLDAQGHTNSADRRAALDAARERAELARAERANQLVEHNAMTLVSMVGALDALVEELVPRAREMLVEHQAQALIDQARGQEPEATARVGDAGLEAIRVAAQKVLNERLGSFDSSPRGTGAKRWEDTLHHAGLQAQPERPIPSDLDQALTEVVALSQVVGSGVTPPARRQDRA